MFLMIIKCVYKLNMWGIFIKILKDVFFYLVIIYVFFKMWD